MELRSDQPETFAERLQQAVAHSNLPELVTDVMTLAALQMVNLPSTGIKPFREPVENHVRNVRQIPLAALARLGSFFWDLMVTGLSYPAHRMHGSKFGEELCDRLCVLSPADDTPGLTESCLWMSAAHFYSSNADDPRFQGWVLERRKTDPMAAAAMLRAFRPNRIASYRVAVLTRELGLVENHARTETSAVRRMILEETAATVRQILEEDSRRRFFPDFGSFANFFSGADPSFMDDDDDDEWDDDDDDEEWDGEDDFDGPFEERQNNTADPGNHRIDPPCFCPSCQAQRQRAARNSSFPPAPSPVHPDPWDDDEDELSLEAAIFGEKLGEDGMERLTRMMAEGEATGRDNTGEIFSFLESRGISRSDFLEYCAEVTGTTKQRPQVPEMSPEEKRAFRRKRKNPMDKKKKRR